MRLLLPEPERMGGIVAAAAMECKGDGAEEVFETDALAVASMSRNSRMPPIDADACSSSSVEMEGVVAKEEGVAAAAASESEAAEVLAWFSSPCRALPLLLPLP